LIAESIPLRWQVPVRYWVRHLRGREDPVLRLLLATARRGSIAVDIGAHTGAYTYPLARRAVVHAFEPLPNCAAMLEAFARTHSHVHVHHIALSDAPGEATMYTPYRDGRPLMQWTTFRPPVGRHDTMSVPVRTLDGYNLRDVSVIKIDVEGHEMAVLRGARETIAREHPTLLVELEQRHHGHDIRSYLTEIEEVGYRGYFLNARRHLRPVRDFDPGTDQDVCRADLADHSYIHDFLFVPHP